jgi:hypothetical protein
METQQQQQAIKPVWSDMTDPNTRYIIYNNNNFIFSYNTEKKKVTILKGGNIFINLPIHLFQFFVSSLAFVFPYGSDYINLKFNLSYGEVQIIRLDAAYLLRSSTTTSKYKFAEMWINKFEVQEMKRNLNYLNNRVEWFINYIVEKKEDQSTEEVGVDTVG